VTYVFDLVPEQEGFRFVDRGFERVVYLLSEFQPATSVQLLDLPPSRIRVRAQGTPCEVAPGILAEIEALVGVSLRFETVD